MLCFGRVDILVNNAAGLGFGPFANLTREDWTYQLGPKLTGAFNCVKHAVPYMVDQGNGRVLNAGRGAVTPVGRVTGTGKRFPADSIITCHLGFRYIGAGALNQLGGPFWCEGLLSSFVGAPLFSQDDAFPLAFPNEGTFEFGKGPHNEKRQVGHGRVVLPK